MAHMALEPLFEALMAPFRYSRASESRGSATSSNVAEICSMASISAKRRDVVHNTMMLKNILVGRPCRDLYIKLRLLARLAAVSKHSPGEALTRAHDGSDWADKHASARGRPLRPTPFPVCSSFEPNDVCSIPSETKAVATGFSHGH